MLRTRLALLVSLVAVRAAGAQQQLGTKIMGGLGIDAGSQAPPGLYLIDRFVQYRADQIRDRNGNVVPIQGLDLLGRGNGLGIAYTFAPRRWPLVTVAASVPWARASVSSEEPLASIDRFGLSDIFVSPLRVGWRYPRYDFVSSYAVFIPTGKFEPKTGVGAGKGYWTNQVSVGGAMYSDSLRTMRASALLSYDMNGRKRGIDITRGNMLQLQGGGGISVNRIVTVGVAGYGLWQVNEDRGADLPQKLLGNRTRSFGLGPELDFTIPAWRLKGDVRYEWDFDARSRPRGAVLAIGVSYAAWMPTKPLPPTITQRSASATKERDLRSAPARSVRRPGE